MRDYKLESPNPIVNIELDFVLNNRLVVCNSIGETSTWNWMSGVEEMKKTLILDTPSPKILSFHLVYYNNCALVAWNRSNQANGSPSIALINYVTNKIMFRYNLELKTSDISMAVAAKGLNYFCLIQESRLHIVDFKFDKKTYRM